jgi:serine/threonine protein kinase
MSGRKFAHYIILEKLGEGGMGVVYKAEDTKLHRPVALKFLSPSFPADEPQRERFQREAQTAASLLHPNIATIFELNEVSEDTPRALYIAMEYVEGEPLSELLKNGPLPEEQVHSIAVQLARGLLAAHEHGVVHCDIKPSNICVKTDGSVKILDFGLAHLREPMARRRSRFFR